MTKWLWQFPQPRFLPRLGLWECPCLLDYLLSRLHISPVSPSAFSAPSPPLFPLTKCQQDYPDWDVKFTLNLENDIDHFVAIVIRWPAFEEGTSHCLTVSEHYHSTSFDQFLPHFHGCKHCHHFQLLDNGLLAFSHYLMSTSTLKKDMTFLDMSTIIPPRPL